MKKIAITQRLTENDSYYEIRECLDINWGKLLKALDFCPVIIPYEYDFETVFENIKPDGIILSGGNDLNRISPSPINKKRDNFEKKIIEYSVSRKLPLLGVCRGMQIIADYFGCDFYRVSNHAGTSHKITAENGSKFYNEIKELKEVNSFHNYAVQNLSNALTVSAFSEDNTIEAIENKEYKIFGQMWHPERENPFKPGELSLIKRIFE